jgi:hypothetical protein
MRASWLALLAIAACSAHAAPSQVSAKYRVLKNGQVFASDSEHFTRQGKKYRIDSTTTASGVFALFTKDAIVLRSEGEVTGKGLRPTHFEHHRGSDPSKLIVANFDWTKLAITHVYDGKSESDTLLPGAQDRISQLYQFMFQPPRGAVVEFHMSTGRKLNLYRYRVLGTETVTTPAGSFQALHLSKEHGKDEDGTELWLAKSRNYFPVRVLIEEKDGGKLEQQLESISFQP